MPWSTMGKGKLIPCIIPFICAFFFLLVPWLSGNWELWLKLLLQADASNPAQANNGCFSVCKINFSQVSVDPGLHLLKYLIVLPEVLVDKLKTEAVMSAEILLEI